MLNPNKANHRRLLFLPTWLLHAVMVETFQLYAFN